MSLGQWDYDYSMPEVDYGFDYYIPDVEFYDYGYVPDVDYGYTPTELPMETYVDEYGQSWTFDDGGNAVSVAIPDGSIEYFDNVTPMPTYSDAATAPEPYPPMVDDAGTVWYFDESGAVYAATDAGGNLTLFGADGTPMEQQSPDGSQTTVPVPSPVSGGFDVSLKDIEALVKTGTSIYRTVTGPTAPAPAPRPTTTTPRPTAPLPTGTQTRVNPATGQTEYLAPDSTMWTTVRPGTTSAQLIPGVSNTVLLVGAGVVGAAFLLAQRRR